MNRWIAKNREKKVLKSELNLLFAALFHFNIHFVCQSHFVDKYPQFSPATLYSLSKDVHTTLNHFQVCGVS